MDGERIIFFEGVGNVLFKKNKRASRLIIRVKSADDVKVTIPWRVSFGQAEAFVNQKVQWIRKTQDTIMERMGARTLFNELTEFSTHSHVLKIERIEGEKVLRKISKNIILVSVPFIREINSGEVQEKIRIAILEAWRREAKEILPGELERLAKQYGFQYRSLSIKNMKSRWGSCTTLNGINLNLHLVRLPAHLRDYIILHELVHTRHKNHGKYFWEKLEEVCEDAKAKSKELKHFRLEIW